MQTLRNPALQADGHWQLIWDRRDFRGGVDGIKGGLHGGDRVLHTPFPKLTQFLSESRRDNGRAAVVAKVLDLEILDVVVSAGLLSSAPGGVEVPLGGYSRRREFGKQLVDNVVLGQPVPNGLESAVLQRLVSQLVGQRCE
jgi:hypothetical protein